MRKHLQQWAAALLSLAACAGMLALPATALKEDSSANAYLCDEAACITDSEFEAAMDEIQETADYIHMNVAVYLGGEPLGAGEYSTITFCDDHYDDMYGINTDGVFLYIDMSGEADLFDYLSTSGLAQFYYTNADDNNRVATIVSDFEEYLPRDAEQVPLAIDNFCRNLQRYYDSGIPDHYYTYNSDNGEYLYYDKSSDSLKSAESYDDMPRSITSSVSISTLVLAAAAAAVITFIISILCIRRSYRFKKSGSTRSYLESGRVQITRHEDRFLREYQTRTRISSESSGGSGGGGGGSSHSSSSGGSHGGGGGHR